MYCSSVLLAHKGSRVYTCVCLCSAKDGELTKQNDLYIQIHVVQYYYVVEREQTLFTLKKKKKTSFIKLLNG